MKIKQFGDLEVRVADTPEELGAHSAQAFADAVQTELDRHDEINAIIALGAAEEPLFEALKQRTDIEWDRINLLQIDVYVGVPLSDPRSGGARLQRNLIDQVRPKAFYPMEGATEPVEAELRRYTELLRRFPPHINVVGIGDTGHLGFIDPPCDFETSSDVIAVALAEQTRVQIAKANIFAHVDEVPRYGISVTIPALMRADHVIALVDEADKAATMKQVVEGPVSIMCPASILQTKPGSSLYLSAEAAACLEPF